MAVVPGGTVPLVGFGLGDTVTVPRFASVNFTSACIADCAPTEVTWKFAPSCTSWTIK